MTKITELTATHGLWASSAPEAPATGRLVEHVVGDVVIIGGGFSGCSTALHLAQAGSQAVVLEADEIGFGGSGRNVGLVNAGLWLMPDDVPAKLGTTVGERLLRQLAEAPGLVFDIVDRFGIACEVERAGTLHCGVGSVGLAEITERTRQWHARGADVELLDSKETARRVGSSAYSGSLLDRRAGTIQPLAYVRGLASAALATGARIYTQTPAMSREDLGTAWRIATPAGSVTAPTVIIATDSYSTGVWSGIKQEQIMMPYFNLATHPLDPALRETILAGREGAWDTATILSSFRFDKAGRLIFGSIGALRGVGTRVHGDWGRRTLLRLFPQLKAVSFEHAWYGTIGMTDDAIPRLHRHDRSVFSISGYNGRGIAPGTTFGRDLARIALGSISVHDLAIPLTEQSMPGLRGVKTVFYEGGAILAHFAGSRTPMRYR